MDKLQKMINENISIVKNKWNTRRTTARHRWMTHTLPNEKGDRDEHTFFSAPLNHGFILYYIDKEQSIQPSLFRNNKEDMTLQDFKTVYYSSI